MGESGGVVTRMAEVELGESGGVIEIAECAALVSVGPSSGSKPRSMGCLGELSFVRVSLNGFTGVCIERKWSLFGNWAAVE